ncbi:FUSC family protein [Planosporangium sp. 12N6]|uniref:FUSC family protein n=1 Tax=Planosporangium spinosum TaxID=3402278 RepID=UPI003CF22EB4
MFDETGEENMGAEPSRARPFVSGLFAAGRPVSFRLTTLAGPPDATRWGRESGARTRRGDKFSGTQVLKVTVAAVVAFVVAQQVLGGHRPMVLAALTALLVVQVTLYETIRHGWQRVGAVVVGVLLAALLSSLFGLAWWSLGVTILSALGVGKVLRLGDHSIEVAVNAMVVIALGSHSHVGLDRVYETLIGATVGVLVSFATPSVQVQPAGNAVGKLADRIGQTLRSVAADIERGWTHERAADAVLRAGGIEYSVRNAQGALAQAEVSLLLNPRRGAAHVPERLRLALTALEYSTIHVRVTCRCLADLAEGAPGADLRDPRVREPLAGLLDAAGEAVSAFGRLVTSDAAGNVDAAGNGYAAGFAGRVGPAGPAGDADALRRAVRRARSLRDAASDALLVDPRKEPKLWRVHGAVLAHLDRLLDDIDPGGNAAAYAISQLALAGAGAAPLPRRSSAAARMRIRAGLRRWSDAA